MVYIHLKAVGPKGGAVEAPDPRDGALRARRHQSRVAPSIHTQTAAISVCSRLLGGRTQTVTAQCTLGPGGIEQPGYVELMRRLLDAHLLPMGSMKYGGGLDDQHL